MTRLRVVYLLGTGATQAEVNLKDDTIHILMKDIREGILKKIDEYEISELYEVRTELSKGEMDVEHLITLYESTGINKHIIIARKLKQLFMQEIQEKITKLGRNYIPKLLPALIDMHQIPSLNEKLFGIITINYEDIIDRAIQIVNKGINYSIKMKKSHRYLRIKPSSIPLLKLHGSFNWKNELPVRLTDDNLRKPEDALWIPPGVEKTNVRYPFNILWGRAIEILNCDILRIIGCSLSRNDWHLVSLLYTTQKLNFKKKSYDIELIDYSNEGEKIRKSYPYLSFRLISEIKEVRESLIKSYSLDTSSTEKLSKSIGSLLEYSDKKVHNIFDIWLRAKGEYLKDRSKPIKTKTRIFENYINEVT